MNKLLYILTIALLAMTACNKTLMDADILPGEVKILVNNNEETKATVSDEFNANTVIAIFSQVKDSENGNSLVKPKDINVSYKQNTNSSFWQPVAPDTAIMFKPYYTLEMFAYSPKDNLNNISVTQQGERTIILNAIKLQNHSIDLTNNDLLYAKASKINKDNLTVNLAFKHLFTKITLNINKSNNWTSTPTLVSAGLTGANLFDKASVKLYDGVASYSKETVGDLTIKWEPTHDMAEVKLSGEPKSIELIVMPTNADDVKIVIQADQLIYHFNIPETTNFTKGKNLIFDIKLDVAPVVPPDVDMTITPTIENWDVSQTHVIVPV